MNNAARDLRGAHPLNEPRALARVLGLERGSQRTARGALVCCPAPDHSDRSPSCHIYRAVDRTVAARCHGCGYSADALGLIATVEGLTSFADVIARAREIASMPAAEVNTYGDSATPAAPLPPAEYGNVARQLLDVCPAERDAEAYLRARGVYAEALADGWGCLPRYGDQADAIRRLIDRVSIDALVRAGVLHQRGDRVDTEHFARPVHRLLIPWRGPGLLANVECVQRRLLRDPREGEPKYVMPTGIKPRHPYGIDFAVEVMGSVDRYDARDLGASTAIVYVEGAIDVLALRRAYAQRGLDRVVVGIPGVQAWRPEWARYARGREALIGLDADAAGEAMVARIAADLRAAGATNVQRIRPKGGAKDWTEMLARGAA